MLTRVTIEHFKSIAHADIGLGDINILVGPNGAGKSNVIDAIRFVKDALFYDLDRAVSERHGIDSIRQWSRFKPYNISLGFEIITNDGIGNYSFTLASRQGNYIIIKEDGSWEDKIDVPDSFTLQDESDWNFLFVRYGRLMGSSDTSTTNVVRKASFSRDKAGTVSISRFLGESENQTYLSVENSDELFLGSARYSAFSPVSAFRNLRDQLANFEAYTIFPNTLRQPQTPSNDSRLLSTGENLTSIFKMLPKTKRGGRIKEEILEGMRLLMQNLENIMIQTIGGVMVPVFRVHEPDGESHNFNVSQISDGSLRVLGLLTALYQPDRPAALALEEPEQTVNPGVLALLSDVIREISKDTQILVTTHSPELVDKFSPDEIHALDLINGVTKISRISESQKKVVRERLFSMSELMSMEGFLVE